MNERLNNQVHSTIDTSAKIKCYSNPSDNGKLNNDTL